MKKKKKKQYSAPAAPAEATASDSDLLESILQEFRTPGQESEAAASLDPALQTPIPRHRTWDSDPETQRYQPSVEDLPERHIPERESMEEFINPSCPFRKKMEDPHRTDLDFDRIMEESGSMGGPDILASHPGRSRKAEPAFRESREPAWRKLRDLFPPRSQEPEAHAQVEAFPEAPASPPPEATFRESPRHGRQVSFPPQAGTPAEASHRRHRRASTRKRTPPQNAIQTPEAQFRRAQSSLKGLSIRLWLCVLFTVLNLALGFSHSQGYLDMQADPKTAILGQILLLLTCAICAFDVLADGLIRLLRPSFGFHTLVVFELIVCLIDGFYAVQAPRCSYCPLASLLLTCALWGLRLKRLSICGSMNPARNSTGEAALAKEPDYFQKTAGILQGTGSLTEFLQANQKAALPQRILDGYGIVVIVFSVIAAGITCGGDIPTFFRYWAATLLAGTPLLGSVAWFRPWSILNRRLQERGAALYGWSGACRLTGKLAVPVSAQDLFPQDKIKLNGVKFFNGQLPDRVVAYGAAVMETAESSLSPIFEAQMEMRAARRYAVTKLRRYEAGGIGAEIGADSVLVGSLGFMQSMGVEMPGGTRVSQAVYVAINGTLAGVFAIHYGVTRAAAESLSSLTACRGVTPVVTASDFIISESFLRTKFRVNTTRIKLPPLPQRAALNQRKSAPDAQPCVLLKEYRFGAVSLAVAGARALRTAVRWGIAVAILSGIMGMVILAILANLAATGVMSMVNLGLFLLIWSIPSLLLSGWPRNA